MCYPTHRNHQNKYNENKANITNSQIFKFNLFQDIRQLGDNFENFSFFLLNIALIFSHI